MSGDSSRVVVGTEDGVWVLAQQPTGWAVLHDQLHGRDVWTVTTAAPARGSVRRHGWPWPVSQREWRRQLATDEPGPGECVRARPGGRSPRPGARLCGGGTAGLVYQHRRGRDLDVHRRRRGVCRRRRGQGNGRNYTGSSGFLLAAPDTLWRTGDAGQVWERATVPAGIRQLAVLQPASHIFAATAEGLYHSVDAGATWVCSLAGACHAVAAALTAPGWRPPSGDLVRLWRPSL
ncbi:MAG: hypothetical protein HZY76_04595 [Anaerolineae bacterium]|nr:MAG: hypothetical protein HZY76_04595 [Anaerolineae bacterium]